MEHSNSNFIEFNPYQKYEGTEQLKWFKSIDNAVRSWAEDNPSYNVISQEISNNILTVNISKDNNFFMSIDCTKDKIVIRNHNSINYKEYSEADIVFRILEDEFTREN